VESNASRGVSYIFVVKYDRSLMDVDISRRFIHSEIYKAYPDVYAMVHSHSFPSPSSRTPRCMGGFLGIWNIDSHG
jgi:hypothetical protein